MYFTTHFPVQLTIRILVDIHVTYVCRYCVYTPEILITIYYVICYVSSLHDIFLYKLQKLGNISFELQILTRL